MSNLTPFTYLNYIFMGDKSDIKVDDKIYNQFLINRGLSLHIDTIAVANEVNKYPEMTNQMHFDYLRNMVSPRKRFAKWPKPKDHKDVAIVSQYYGINMSKAYDLYMILDKDQIKEIKKELDVDK